MTLLYHSLKQYGHKLLFPEYSFTTTEEKFEDMRQILPSVPRSRVYEYCKTPIVLNICTFGHLGDGNLHINFVLTPQLVQQIQSSSDVNGEMLQKHLLELIQTDIDDIVYGLTVHYQGKARIFVCKSMYRACIERV